MALSVLQLDKVTPRGGPEATSVVVTGSGFGVVQGSITFDPLGDHGGPYPVTGITLWQDDRIEYVAPTGFSLPDRDNRFYDVHIQKDGATDGLPHPWWVPDSTLTLPPPPVSADLDYQWPAFDAGVNQDVDDPREWKASDFNRVLDRLLAVVGVGGDMTKAVYDINDDGIVGCADGIDDAGTCRTWAEIVALAASGIDPKDACRAGTTQDLSLEGTGNLYLLNGGASGRGQFTWTTGPTTLDGVVLANGDRILVKDQTSGDTNGIYVRTSQNVWDRATDFDSDAEVTQGAYTFVVEGATNLRCGHILLTPDPITIGGPTGTVLTWGLFTSQGGGVEQQEELATEVITGTDTVLAATLAFVPVSNASVVGHLNGNMLRQGPGLDYTVSGQAITWLANTGLAVDMDTLDVLTFTYES